MISIVDGDMNRLLANMRFQVQSRHDENLLSESYYESTATLKNLGIAIPSGMSDIGVTSDWPSTIVDAYHERLVFEMWKSQHYDMETITDLYDVSSTVAEATLDASIFGVGFLAVDNPSLGPTSALDWVFRTVSPFDGTLLWDYGRNRPLAGYRKVPKMDNSDLSPIFEVLYLPGENVIIESNYDGGKPRVVARHRTGCPHPAMQRVRSKLRSKRFYGKSAISPAVRYYTDAAMRTLLGMEINREFYTTPQRWIMNAEMSMFTDSDDPSEEEKRVAGWKAAAGKILAYPPPEDGEPEAKAGQFTAAPPTPYLEQIRGYSQLLASATGMPSAYLGFSTENPPSADAIRAWLERLVRSARYQQKLISPDLKEIGWVLHTVHSGSLVDYRQFKLGVADSWENPATETLAADTDALTKLIAAGVVDPTSDWAYDRIRMPEHQRKTNRAALKAKQAAERLNTMLDKAKQLPVAPEAQQAADTIGVQP